MLPRPRVCLITDEALPDEKLLHLVEGACNGGCRWIQLRLRNAGGRRLLGIARSLRRITRVYSASLVVHDRIDIALACDADGVHLPAAGFKPSTARRLIGPNRLLGRSVHGIAEIESLRAEPLDYLQFGPVYETPSKRRYGPPQGIERLAQAVAAGLGRPIIAVGGIDAGCAREPLAAGAAGIAVIRAVSGGAGNIERRAAELIAAVVENQCGDDSDVSE